MWQKHVKAELYLIQRPFHSWKQEKLLFVKILGHVMKYTAHILCRISLYSTLWAKCHGKMCQIITHSKTIETRLRLLRRSFNANLWSVNIVWKTRCFLLVTVWYGLWFYINLMDNELIHTQIIKWLAEQIVCFFLKSLFIHMNDGPYNFGHFPVSPKLNIRN